MGQRSPEWWVNAHRNIHTPLEYNTYDILLANIIGMASESEYEILIICFQEKGPGILSGWFSGFGQEIGEVLEGDRVFCQVYISFDCINHFIGLLIIGLSLTGCGGNTGSATGSSREKKTEDPSGVAEISFDHTEHDFGEIAEGEKVGCIFKYENTGSDNLIIQKASGSCGCTVPRWKKEPVPPGGSGQLEVIFDSSGRSGKQNKTITVTSNSINKVTILAIKADVVRSEP